MLVEYLMAVGLIFVAEMGDKTQILAMAFATKYKIKQVLAGIFIGSFLNHGLAVILGASLSTIIPIQSLQVVAGISFVGFALWTLKLDEEEPEEVKQSYGPIITIALAFFIGELGDKTQLTAIVLSSDAEYPFLILLGTVTGMVITGALGIWVGSKLGSKIPEFTIKMVSAAVFMLFGIIKLGQNLPNTFLSPMLVSLYSIVIITVGFFVLRPTLKVRKEHRTKYQQAAQRLYDFYHKMKLNMDEICLGENICGQCKENSCIVGATKELLRSDNNHFDIDLSSLNKDFDKSKVIKSMVEIVDYLRENDSTDTILTTLNHLETILFGNKIKFLNIDDYLIEVEKIDKSVYQYLK